MQPRLATRKRAGRGRSREPARIVVGFLRGGGGRLFAGGLGLVLRRALRHVLLDQLDADLLGGLAYVLLVAAGRLLADLLEVLLHVLGDAGLSVDLLLARLDRLLGIRVGRSAAGVVA